MYSKDNIKNDSLGIDTNSSTMRQLRSVRIQNVLTSNTKHIKNLHLSFFSIAEITIPSFLTSVRKLHLTIPNTLIIMSLSRKIMPGGTLKNANSTGSSTSYQPLAEFLLSPRLNAGMVDGHG